MITPEMFAKFQSLCPPCHFCKSLHGGEGYSQMMIEDTISGLMPYLGYYLCSACQPRRAEADAFYGRQMRRVELINDLAEAKLFRFNQKYRLSEAREQLELTTGLYAHLNEWPLTRNAWLWSKTTGIGKTHAARCVGCRFVWSLKPVAELSGAKLSDIGEHWGRDREAEVKPFLESPLVIVDDIDKAIWTLKSVNMVYRIMNERYDLGLRTIVTSNTEPAKLIKSWDGLNTDQCYGTSIWDRMFPFEAFEVKGQPRRG